jgi:hypothetical protein
MVDLHLIQLLQFLLGLLVELLLDLQLRRLFRGPGRSIALLLADGLTLTPISPRPVELLKERGEIIDGGQLVKAEELLLLYLLVGEGVLGECSLEEVEGIEEVDVGSRVFEGEVEVVLETALQIV